MLITQLAAIRGLLGIRPDHEDQPLPALVDTDEGKMALDAQGQPSWPAARVRSDLTDHMGARTIRVEASNEAQFLEWKAKQQAMGLDVRSSRRVEQRRFLDIPAEFRWTFGGEYAFREIARIALNILATRDPHGARLPGLAAAKDWIRGLRSRHEGEAPYVWHHDGSIDLPTCAFPFGHRIAIRSRAATGTIDALVSFFDTIAYVVSFGAVGATRDDLVVFDIDPQADSPPHDLKVTSLSKDPFPSVVVRPASSNVSESQHAHLRARFSRLIDHIESRQNVLYMTPVTERLNAARALPQAERHAEVVDAVNGCRGHVLKLLKYSSEQFALKANTHEAKALSNAITALICMDPRSGDGLSQQARAAVSLAEMYLVTAIEGELDGGPLTVERVILLLNGTPGAEVAFHAIMEPLLAAVLHLEHQFRSA